MAVKRAQIDGIDGPARRAAHPQEPKARRDRRADGRGKQHRHAPRLPLVPEHDQPLRIGDDLRIGGALLGGLFFGTAAALVFHFAAVKTHSAMVADPDRKSTTDLSRDRSCRRSTFITCGRSCKLPYCEKVSSASR